MTAKISLGLLALSLVAAGCENLLDVQNPNNVPESEIHKPEAAPALLSGVLSSVARGVERVNLPLATVTDELDWVGSRDAWRQLELGKLSDPFNEFTDAAFPWLAEARWFADEAIEIMQVHADSGRLQPGKGVDPVLLVRAYVYGAIAYTTIGDLFDRWALSEDSRNPAPAIPPDQMRQMYDTAIVYLNRADSMTQDSVARSIMGGATADAWRRTTIALRARAQHARAIWDMLGPVPTSPAIITNQGLVNDAGAVVDAQLALSIAVSGSPDDWRFQFAYGETTIGSDFGAWVNSRQEMRLGNVYVVPHSGNLTFTDTRILDPITNARDPVLFAIATTFKCGVPGSATCTTKATEFPAFTVTSAREMHLVLAEAALAAGDTATFATQINALRGLNTLADWNPGAPQIRADSLLWYERQVNLFLQGRRLADMYRFGLQDTKWLPTSEAVTQPGRFLPMTARECLSNPLIGAENCRI